MRISTLLVAGLLLATGAQAQTFTLTAKPPVPASAPTGNLVLVATGTGRVLATPLPGFGLISVQAYSSTGASTSATTLTVGGSSDYLAGADLDGDGLGDLVVANNQAGTVQVFYQGAGLTWTAGPTLAAPTGPTRVAVGDLNADGRPDLVAAAVDPTGAQPYPNKLLVGLATAARAYATPVSYRRASSLGAVTGLAVGDLTGDGRPDVLLATTAGLSVSPGSAAGTLGTDSFTATPAAYTDLAVADLNADGRPDLAAAVQGVAGVYVLLTTSTGLGTPTTLPVAASAAGITTADLDADGRPDLVATINSQRGLALLLATGGAGQFRAASYTSPATGSGSWGRVLGGNIAGNGRADVVLQDVNAPTSGATVLLVNTASLATTAPVAVAPLLAWPNPSAGVVELGGLLSSDQVLVHDLAGRELPAQRAGQFLTLPAPGPYLVEVRSAAGVRRAMVVIR